MGASHKQRSFHFPFNYLIANLQPWPCKKLLLIISCISIVTGTTNSSVSGHEIFYDLWQCYIDLIRPHPGQWSKTTSTKTMFFHMHLKPSCIDLMLKLHNTTCFCYLGSQHHPLPTSWFSEQPSSIEHNGDLELWTKNKFNWITEN